MKLKSNKITFTILIFWLGLMSGCLFDEEKKPEWPDITSLEEIEGCWLETRWLSWKPCVISCFSTDSTGYSIYYDFTSGYDRTPVLQKEGFGRTTVTEYSVFTVGSVYKYNRGSVSYDSSASINSTGILYTKGDTLLVVYIGSGEPPSQRGIRLTPENTCGETFIYFDKPSNWNFYSG